MPTNCSHTRHTEHMERTAEKNRLRLVGMNQLVAVLHAFLFKVPGASGESGMLYRFSQGWDEIARIVMDNPGLHDEVVRDIFLECAVDAFLEHKYFAASGIYMAHLFVCASLAYPRPEYFLQSSIVVVCEGHRGVEDMDTPWGAEYVPWPAGTDGDQVWKHLVKFLAQCQAVAGGEGALLREMQDNPHVRCDCLHYEDPYHPDFGKQPPRIRTRPLSEPKVPWFLSCARCGTAAPSEGEGLARCGRCKRVRYCSRECQETDWPSHKKICNKARAGWWGTDIQHDRNPHDLSVLSQAHAAAMAQAQAMFADGL